MNLAKRESIDGALTALIDALALLLIPLDATPTRLATILRASFVKAGAVHARMQSSGRPHIARIAALTGLSRVEVKKIVDANFRVERSVSDDLPRALRVLQAWRNLGRYSRNGKPKRLPIVGERLSFYSLCREFSGDIPHTVILRELDRRNLIRYYNNRTRVGVASSRLDPASRAQDLDALKFVAAFLESAANPERLVVRRREKVIVSQKISPSYAESAIASRVNELLDHVPGLFAGAGKQAKRCTTHLVFALISRNKAVE